MKKSSKFYAMIILIVALLVMIGYYLHNNQSKRIDMDLQGSLVRLDSHVLTVYNVRNFNDYETIDLHSIAKKFDSAIRYVAYNNEALYLLLEEKNHTWSILRIANNAMDLYALPIIENDAKRYQIVLDKDNILVIMNQKIYQSEREKFAFQLVSQEFSYKNQFIFSPSLYGYVYMDSSNVVRNLQNTVNLISLDSYSTYNGIINNSYLVLTRMSEKKRFGEIYDLNTGEYRKLTKGPLYNFGSVGDVVLLEIESDNGQPDFFAPNLLVNPSRYGNNHITDYEPFFYDIKNDVSIKLPEGIYTRALGQSITYQSEEFNRAALQQLKLLCESSYN